MKKLYNVLGQLVGFLVILLFAFQLLNDMFGFNFTGVDEILNIFDTIKIYLVYVLAGLAGLELVAGKKLLGFLYFLILAFVIIATFFQDILPNF